MECSEVQWRGWLRTVVDGQAVSAIGEALRERSCNGLVWCEWCLQARARPVQQRAVSDSDSHIDLM